jgi:hypothetical protein
MPDRHVLGCPTAILDACLTNVPVAYPSQFLLYAWWCFLFQLTCLIISILVRQNIISFHFMNFFLFLSLHTTTTTIAHKQQHTHDVPIITAGSGLKDLLVPSQTDCSFLYYQTFNVVILNSCLNFQRSNIQYITAHSQKSKDINNFTIRNLVK